MFQARLALLTLALALFLAVPAQASTLRVRRGKRPIVGRGIKLRICRRR